MRTVANATRPTIQPVELNAIAADCVALEHLRVFRHLLVKRCGVVAAAIAVGGSLLGLLHSFAYWFSIAIFVAAPAGAWMIERRQGRPA